MSDGGPTLATRACSTCRRGKRRCTKEIPTCSLCRKNGKQCDYGTVGSPATDSESPIQRPSNSHPPNRASQSTLFVAPPPPPSFTVPVPANRDFPALFFLDSSYFELHKHSLEKQRLNLPQELIGRLSGQAQMRYVNLGSKYRPFACKDARPDDFLPIDDKDWDQGELSLVQPLAVSTNTEVQVPPFARTCQAAHLLSRVLRHLNDGDTDPEFRFQEAIQLHRTSQALYSTILRESEAMVERMSDPTAHLPFSTAIGLCLSTLLSLYDNYACTERNQPDQMGSPTFLEMQTTAISGVKEISSAVFQFSGRIRAVAELGGCCEQAL
ncbi:hypothetical protein FDECE_2666 [Fusarium decemcellulare]|nr:hypothetical protein FDECE_2666 [Fusarium decemcellulare]